LVLMKEDPFAGIAEGFDPEPPMAPDTILYPITTTTKPRSTNFFLLFILLQVSQARKIGMRTRWNGCEKLRWMLTSYDQS